MDNVKRNAMERAIVMVCSIVMWVTTVVIFLILTGNTVVRYAGGAGLPWASELPELLFPWLVMAGVVLAAEKGGHIATVFLIEALPPRAQRILGAGGWLIVVALYATLSKATYSMLDIVHDEKSPILHVPGSVTYGCVLGGMVMLALLALQAAWKSWRANPTVKAIGTGEAQSAHW